MTVQELINELQKIENKELEVYATKTFWSWDKEFWDDVSTYFEEVHVAEDGSCVKLHQMEI